MEELKRLGPWLRYQGERRATARVLAAVCRGDGHRPARNRPIDTRPGPALTAHVSAAPVTHAWVLLQEDAQSRVHMELEIARGSCDDGRTALTWTTTRIRPGQSPAMCGPGVQDIVLHT